MKRKYKSKIIICISIVIITLLFFFIYIVNSLNHPFKVTNNKEFEIKSGDTLYGVISNLDSKGLIRNPIIIKAYVKYKKVPGNIKPGLYTLSSNLTVEKFINNINNGAFDKNTVFVTIPEGYDLLQIAELLDKKGVIAKEDFIKANNNYKLPNYINKNNNRKYKLEGYLFPDTYQLKKNMSGEKVINLMLTHFEKRFSALLKENNISLDKSKYDNIITMASIVEGEAKKDDERSIIASVFYNRLNKNMKLQSCATVEYALGYHKDKLYNKDLEIKSNYNTYYVNGLPAGPICNPGLKSIEAALKPKNTNYIYFVSNNDGTHFFTDNYKKFEEVKNITQGSN
ncbi:conserved hypothetical protein, YceG family [Clostridium pasteurianum DSM 525 = ATCC 6013]|uniref:Endolytic murein transglycosylase n=1 Tax=Clostridium pasteurianum DSM 525 = ATCC 6013 TaxID=1262449 RepID=A0A0H3J550_CLOPA|nr:endolytic transglycosylase MltG [Clostridium pasteurianum]AJA48212.1 conserved hypothetical protein, YceG family [Clostridium pasteurianum DSM 525 = ATCC 6013]AJA52200.1 conserved hypothetical protein, YceG family [Clostridium pasteurianum DSM 525 = ATCC 6013]ELP60636.1 hypothetical protein F502_04087 [Clostridium pasteurianum DSM 525 = ATCC 6013]KRU11790.1 aminodeoxychorismate lyase [Clostridium pasteurianum DSM 525 = ATCC 6013]UZW12429.1 endolytic transglycosylase MltG [Clostridium pasteu